MLVGDLHDHRGAGLSQVDFDIEIAEARRLIVDSHLANASTLAAGTPVARVTLIAVDGPPRELLLRAGVETGEWAGRATAEEGPRPWLSWVATDGRFLGRRFRHEVELVPPLGTAPTVRVERARDLPDDVTLSLFQLEVRR